MGRRALLMGIAGLAMATTAQAQGKVKVQWLGHAAFLVTSPGGTQLLLDPWITENPSVPDSLKDLSHYKPAAILVTHSHSDHSADAKAIAVASGAPVVSAYEWVAAQGLPEKQTLGGNVGGTFKIGDVTIHLVTAVHSSEPGRPVGFVLEFTNGQTIYDTGDTWIFGDMALIQEIYHPTVILLQVGGGPYNEDPKTAKLAITKYFHPTAIIPMHYATFPGLATEADVRTAFAGDSRVMILRPGNTRTF
ncbi:MAG TPA: metal-dependent hydrolase [Gemmatimonadaceae bacterium]|jgi:L-ascorbate metabolism protein UlaG (beta-lactamase superfamily)|nr:metal-dependent hydrolase [Gemmatimonadaceae bacterium]